MTGSPLRRLQERVAEVSREGSVMRLGLKTGHTLSFVDLCGRDAKVDRGLAAP
jgi:hypothetical protein